MANYSKNKNEYRKTEFYRTPWNQLSQEEKDEIVEKAKLRREEEQRRINKKIAAIMLGVQRTQENSWE